MVDVEWPVLEMMVPAAQGSPAQRAAVVEETETEEKGGKERVKVKTGDAGGMRAVLSISNDISSRMSNSEKRLTKLESQDTALKSSRNV